MKLANLEDLLETSDEINKTMWGLEFILDGGERAIYLHWSPGQGGWSAVIATQFMCDMEAEILFVTDKPNEALSKFQDKLEELGGGE